MQREEFIKLYKPIKFNNSYIVKKDNSVANCYQDFIINKACWSVIKENENFILIPGYQTGSDILGFVFTEIPFKTACIKVLFNEYKGLFNGVEEKA